MSYCIGVQFSFPCNSLRRLQSVAAQTLCDKHDLSEEDREDFDDSYTELMLEQTADNPMKYIHGGNKGDMFMWGGIWNYYNAEIETKNLQFFLRHCWEYGDCEKNIIFDFNRALLIINKEQSEISDIYEFRKNSIVKHITIELSWNE